MLDVLLVDDDESVREGIAGALVDAGHRVTQACDGEEALSLLATQAFDLAVCDVQMPKVDGLTLFRRVRLEAPGMAVVIMTSYGSIPDVVATLRGGAVDYITKPFDPETFAAKVVAPIAERRHHLKKFEEARNLFVERCAGSAIVGTSLALRQLRHSISVIAKTDSSVILWGEPGTGKKLAARTIHVESPRREGPFVVVPCASLPDLMLETELRDLTEMRPRHARDNWFRAAEGGTLVLDGIETLPVAAQASLLRVIDEPLLRAQRGADWKPIGVRLVSIARESPARWIPGRAFLEPLFFRLSMMQLRVPSLSERGGDRYVLVNYFLREFTPPGRVAPSLTPRASMALSTRSLPGNVRELAWTIESAVAASEGREIDVEHLPEKPAGTPPHG
jgi:DNA-binding NtrC family response regulator